MGEKRTAGSASLADIMQVKCEDVKKLFSEQRGYLKSFFDDVGTAAIEVDPQPCISFILDVV